MKYAPVGAKGADDDKRTIHGKVDLLGLMPGHERLYALVMREDGKYEGPFQWLTSYEQTKLSGYQDFPTTPQMLVDLTADAYKDHELWAELTGWFGDYPYLDTVLLYWKPIPGK